MIKISEKNNLDRILLQDLPMNNWVGDDTQKWRLYSSIRQNVEFQFPQMSWEGMVNWQNEEVNLSNVEKQNRVRKLDRSKLLYSTTIDREKCIISEDLEANHAALYKEFKKAYLRKHPKGTQTVKSRIRQLKQMAEYEPDYNPDNIDFKVNWFTFDEDPYQLINQLWNRWEKEYPRKAKETGKKNYGCSQMKNFYKSIKKISKLVSADISWWWNELPEIPEIENDAPPPCSPVTAYKLIHNKYEKDRLTNALIKIIIFTGLFTGLRPKDLISIQTHQVIFELGCIRFSEEKKNARRQNYYIEDEDFLTGKRQPSLLNWIEIWRPKMLQRTGKKHDFLFMKPKGEPFRDSHELCDFLRPYCKPIYEHFSPYMFRRWNATAWYSRGKQRNESDLTRYVRDKLGHKKLDTTDRHYLKHTDELYTRFPVDWFRVALKCNPTSDKMKRLIKQYSRTEENRQKNHQTIKNRCLMVKNPPVGDNGPGGIRTFILF